MSRPKKIILSLLILCSVLLLVWGIFIAGGLRIGFRPLPVKHFSFSGEDGLEGWEEKVLRGRVKYTIEDFNGESCVFARSEKTASALYYKARIDIGRHPILSWRWNVVTFPEKQSYESLIDSEEDDYGARVYVIFPALYIGGTKALEYVWTEHLPKGDMSSSPYTSNIKLIVLESGYSKKGEWVYERRDLYEDYLTAFGEKPRLDIGAIAFMTDADSTQTVAEAVYDDIRIEYKGGD